MIKFTYENRYAGTVDACLHDYLTPEKMGSNSGALEDTRDEVKACSESIGRLLEKLIEKKVLTFEEAEEICGKSKAHREYKYTGFKLEE